MSVAKQQTFGEASANVSSVHSQVCPPSYILPSRVYYGVKGGSLGPGMVGISAAKSTCYVDNEKYIKQVDAAQNKTVLPSSLTLEDAIQQLQSQQMQHNQIANTLMPDGSAVGGNSIASKKPKSPRGFFSSGGHVVALGIPTLEVENSDSYARGILDQVFHARTEDILLNDPRFVPMYSS